MNRKNLEELQHAYSEPVRDPLWKHIYLSPPMEKLIRTKEFLRLGRIRQLGPARLVYPGATHTRYSHSLGVFFLAREMIKALIVAGEFPSMPAEKIRGFLCAALLHDIGHYPHAHSFKDLPLLDHEVLSGRIIRDGDLARILRNDVGTDPELVASIIDMKTSPETDDPDLRFFRNILSGVLDPDKLDYLNRDAYFCGVPYGTQDTDFVISQIYPVTEGIALTAKGVTAVENLLFSKYLMYKTVYWHHTVRISTALISKAVYLALNEGLIPPEELYYMDDEEFHLRYSRQDHPVFALIAKAETPSAFRIVAETESLKAMDLAERNTLEARIAREISRRAGVVCRPEEVVLDIPPVISFEVDLPVIFGDRLVPFMDCGSVFSAPVVSGFTEALRRIRLILPERIAADCSGSRLFDSPSFLRDMVG